MRTHRAGLAAAVILATAGLIACLATSSGQARDTLPSSLSDADFWALTGQLSEPNGFFQSNSGSTDNLLSNENTVSSVAAVLAQRVSGAGVYLGVGPEQNFTYIAATRPRIALITDIRRGNLHLHLLYKALFEMSSTRAEFVGRLFSRRMPPDLSANPSADDLMSAARRGTPSDAAGFTANLTNVIAYLTTTRHLPLDADDRAGIDYVYRNFHRFGPDIHYTSSINGSRRMSSYGDIMASTDRATGAERTYLASDANFAFVKGLETKNLIVPLVGDFAGPKTIRAIGTYLKAHGATVSAFYVSNVEQYLQRNGVWPAFCANVATLPLTEVSLFIRPNGGSAGLSSMVAETSGCGRR